MRILAFADLHYCTTWPFLRLEDFEQAFARICGYAVERQPNVVLFLGDRFRARQPRDQVRALADRQLRELANIQARHDGQVVCLVGNHDRYSESCNAGDTYTTVGIFQDVLPNVWVVREPGTTVLSFDAPTPPLMLHALPAGYRYNEANYHPDPSRINVFAFHGLVRGGYYDAKGTVVIDDKAVVSLADLDSPAWDVVLGGDVHIPQKFHLTRTVGGYVGATLRLTEADVDDWRGFLDVDIPVKGTVKITKVEGGGPRFVALDLTTDPTTWPGATPYADAIVIATIKGSAAQLRKVPDALVRDHFKTARIVRVHRRFDHEVPLFVPSITATSTPFEDAATYIRSTDRDGLDEARLVAKAATALGVEPAKKGGIF